MALSFAAFALVAGITGQARAADADGPVEFGLIDVATGLPASGKAIPVEDEGLEYARDLGSGIAIHELGSGVASYYGERFAGKPTASGEIFDPGELTAAHRSLPFGSMVLVTNDETGKSVVVKINDRGPYHGNRVIDLSKEAASRIGLIQKGSGAVSLALLAE